MTGYEQRNVMWPWSVCEISKPFPLQNTKSMAVGTMVVECEHFSIYLFYLFSMIYYLTVVLCGTQTPSHWTMVVFLLQVSSNAIFWPAHQVLYVTFVFRPVLVKMKPNIT